MATKLHTATEAPKSTIIGVLHAQWDRANEAYNANDEATTHPAASPAEGVRNCHLRDGQKWNYDDAHRLQMALLRQQPTTWRDALLLTAHITSLADGIEEYVDDYRKEAVAAVGYGLDSLLVFMADETDEDIGNGWLKSTLHVCRNRYYLRTGQPQKWGLES